MNRFKKLAVVLFILFPLFILVPKVSSEPSLTGHKIVIDAGHGGDEGGSLACPGLREADVNLDIALRLKALLEANNENTVYMTRTGDETLSNRDRYTKANSTDGEVLVSIHLNGSSDFEVNGTMGLYGKKNKDKKFTEAMHENMPIDLDVADLGVTNFASGLLLKSNMPATIQETVFISNTQECEWLHDDTGWRQQDIAQALYNGLVNWFNQTPNDGGGNGDEPNCPPNSNSPKCR